MRVLVDVARNHGPEVPFLQALALTLRASGGDGDGCAIGCGGREARDTARIQGSRKEAIRASSWVRISASSWALALPRDIESAVVAAPRATAPMVEAI